MSTKIFLPYGIQLPQMKLKKRRVPCLIETNENASKDWFRENIQNIIAYKINYR